MDCVVINLTIIKVNIRRNLNIKHGNHFAFNYCLQIEITALCSTQTGRGVAEWQLPVATPHWSESVRKGFDWSTGRVRMTVITAGVIGLFVCFDRPDNASTSDSPPKMYRNLKACETNQSIL